MELLANQQKLKRILTYSLSTIPHSLHRPTMQLELRILIYLLMKIGIRRVKAKQDITGLWHSPIPQWCLKTIHSTLTTATRSSPQGVKNQTNNSTTMEDWLTLRVRIILRTNSSCLKRDRHNISLTNTSVNHHKCRKGRTEEQWEGPCPSLATPVPLSWRKLKQQCKETSRQRAVLLVEKLVTLNIKIECCRR